MKRHLHYRDQPLVCACQQATDTAEWHGKRRSGAGLVSRTALHLADCVHSELRITTLPMKPKRLVARLTLA